MTTKRPGDSQRFPAIERDHLQMLFELHHRQLNETQQQIQSIVEKAVGLVLLMTSWIVLSTGSPSLQLKVILAIGVGLFALVTCLFLATHAIGRRRVAAVVSKLNEHLGLFSTQEGQGLYPPEWRTFGCRSLVRMIGAHMATIAIVSAVAIIAIVFKK